MSNTPQRIALVTGGNKGIGFEIARQLAKAGLKVWLGARDPRLGTAAARALQEEQLDVRFVQLDVTNTGTVMAAAQAIEADGRRLDVLVNNAGINDREDGLPGQVDIAVVRRVMDTNYFGTLTVTQALLPLLRQSESAHIVNVSSGLGSLTLNSDPQWKYAAIKLTGYNTSKAALNMLTVLLAHELRDTAISVNSADPEFTAADLNGHQGNQTVEQGAGPAKSFAWRCCRHRGRRAASRVPTARTRGDRSRVAAERLSRWPGVQSYAFAELPLNSIPKP